MEVQEVLTQVKDAMSASRVYGDPYERNGVVVIPAARVGGGAGGGGGEGTQPDKGGGKGYGLGYGLDARPVGAFVIRGDTVEWKPAVDTTSVLLRAQAGLILLLLLFLRRRP